VEDVPGWAPVTALGSRRSSAASTTCSTDSNGWLRPLGEELGLVADHGEAVKLSRLIAGLVGVFLVVFGLWAFFGPRSFFDQVATFPPYNRHLLHDIGAFQVGMGLALILAVRWADALSVALAGVGAGATFHAAAHWWDRDLGGKSSDPYVLTALALVLVVAALARRRVEHR
jgi:uncharacterized membrane protein